MPRHPALLVVAGVAALLGPGLAAPPSAASWRWPVRGRVVGAFVHEARTPFLAGQRRGLDLAAPPGAVVRAACSGPVVFAGPLPGRALGVTVRCGALRATLLGLGRLTVRRGLSVRAGAPVGELGRSGVLRLGARRAGERFGYVDPAPLLASDPVVAPPVLGPPVRRRSRPRRPTPPPPLPSARPVTTGPAAPPTLAWAGLALAAAGVPLGGLARRRTRRRGAERTAIVRAAHDEAP
jgi:hypothetical protein